MLGIPYENIANFDETNLDFFVNGGGHIECKRCEDSFSEEARQVKVQTELQLLLVSPLQENVLHCISFIRGRIKRLDKCCMKNNNGICCAG
jgi:hypothetical protein